MGSSSEDAPRCSVDLLNVIRLLQKVVTYCAGDTKLDAGNETGSESESSCEEGEWLAVRDGRASAAEVTSGMLDAASLLVSVSGDPEVVTLMLGSLNLPEAMCLSVTGSSTKSSFRLQELCMRTLRNAFLVAAASPLLLRASVDPEDTDALEQACIGKVKGLFCVSEVVLAIAEGSSSSDLLVAAECLGHLRELLDVTVPTSEPTVCEETSGAGIASEYFLQFLRLNATFLTDVVRDGWFANAWKYSSVSGASELVANTLKVLGSVVRACGTCRAALIKRDSDATHARAATSQEEPERATIAWWCFHLSRIFDASLRLLKSSEDPAMSPHTNDVIEGSVQLAELFGQLRSTMPAGAATARELAANMQTDYHAALQRLDSEEPSDWE